MSTLVFPSKEALQLALTSNLVPQELQAAPAVTCPVDDGILVALDKKLKKAQSEALKTAGVKVLAKRPKLNGSSKQVNCWAEILAPLWEGDENLQTPIAIFVIKDEQSMLKVAGELLRLGCDKQEFSLLPNGVVLLRALQPPYYSLAQALDRKGWVKAFVPTPPGQEKVWIEAGYSHPLERSVEPQGTGLLFITGEGDWKQIEAGTWHNLYQLLNIQLPTTKPHKEATKPKSRLEVRLKLTRCARDTTPTMWVLRGNAIAVVDQLIRTLPETEVKKLLFAVEYEEDPTVILKARNAAKTPMLSLSSLELSSWLQIDNLFLPADAILEPPLKKDTIKALLTPNADDVVWITPKDIGYEVESIAYSAFSPLSDWINYLIHAHAPKLKPWVRSTEFDFDMYESVGMEWDERPKPEKPKPVKSQITKPSRVEETVVEEAVIPEEEAPQGENIPIPIASLPERELSAPEQALQETQTAFLNLDAPADDPRRNSLWGTMAQLNEVLGNNREATLCWTRLLWEVRPDQSVAERWANCEKTAYGDESTIELTENPTRQQVCAVVSQIVYADLARSQTPYDPQQLKIWMDAYDNCLDSRSLWLGRVALSRMVGGDQLQLVQTRDRIFDRLIGGLSVETDVPWFIRFGSEGTSQEVSQLSIQLNQVLTTFNETNRKRSAIEAPRELTDNYVRLIFAYGFARLGQTDQARELRTQASQQIDLSDPIHRFLVQAYSVRIEHALEGLPAETALPAEIAGPLNQLERFSRYKVDRLRNDSIILEPHERLSPLQAYLQGGADPRGDEFASMRGMTDQTQLSSGIREILQRACSVTAEQDNRLRLFDGILDFLPLLSASEAVPYLTQLVSTVENVETLARCRLLTKALMVSGLFQRSTIIQQLIDQLNPIISELGQAGHSLEIGEVLTACLRSLRRVGLKDRAEELLTRGSQAVRGENIDALIARLQLAAGLADLGNYASVEDTLRSAISLLEDDKIKMIDRLRVNRALAYTYSYMPQEYAFAGLSNLMSQLPNITDSFNTNSHYCMSVLNFMESIVLGYANDALALGEFGRNWLDQDEYLIRRRIHHDLMR